MKARSTILQVPQSTVPGSPAGIAAIGATKIPVFGGNAFPQTIAPGATVPLQATGEHVYMLVCSLAAGINIQLKGAEWLGEQCPIYQGTGYDVPEGSSPFTTLFLTNPSAINVTVLVWAGYGNFRDQRIFLPSSNPQITRPIYSKVASGYAANVLCTDISGTQFNDDNGNSWLAISRVKILFSNMDAVNNWLVQKTASASYNDGSAVLNVPASTDIELDTGGSFKVWGNGGQVQGVISDIYTSIPVNVPNL